MGPEIVRYALDTGVSRFTVRAFATGMLSAFGHSPTFAIRQYSGEVHFNPETLEGASLRLAIKSPSLEVADNISDKDRRDIEAEMRERVLEIGKYPEIVYECSRVTGEQSGRRSVQRHIEWRSDFARCDSRAIRYRESCRNWRYVTSVWRVLSEAV